MHTVTVCTHTHTQGYYVLDLGSITHHRERAHTVQDESRKHAFFIQVLKEKNKIKV